MAGFEDPIHRFTVPFYGDYAFLMPHWMRLIVEADLLAMSGQEIETAQRWLPVWLDE